MTAYNQTAHDLCCVSGECDGAAGRDGEEEGLQDSSHAGLYLVPTSKLIVSAEHTQIVNASLYRGISLSSTALVVRFFGKRPVKQPAYVIREESLLPQADLTDLQKRNAGPESLLLVCKACADNCFVPGRVSLTWACSAAPGVIIGVETAPDL